MSLALELTIFNKLFAAAGGRWRVRRKLG